MSRNLLEYPITVDEITDAIKEAAQDAEDEVRSLGICGDMRPMLLRAALDVYGGEVVYARKEGVFTYITVKDYANKLP